MRNPNSAASHSRSTLTPTGQTLPMQPCLCHPYACDPPPELVVQPIHSCQGPRRIWAVSTLHTRNYTVTAIALISRPPRSPSACPLPPPPPPPAPPRLGICSRLGKSAGMSLCKRFPSVTLIGGAAAAGLGGSLQSRRAGRRLRSWSAAATAAVAAACVADRWLWLRCCDPACRPCCALCAYAATLVCCMRLVHAGRLFS